MKTALFTLLIALTVAPSTTPTPASHPHSPTLNVRVERSTTAQVHHTTAKPKAAAPKVKSVHVERKKPAPKAPAPAKTHSWSNSYPWGQCTWAAAQLAHDNVNGLHNAGDWFANAKARGMPVGYTPRVGATVTFQPGVQGAGGLGHVAHVIAVYANGYFLLKEMNFLGYGGGFGIWSTRTAHAGPGVGFIY